MGEPSQTPPNWPLRLLRFFLKDEYLEEIEGDMEELYQDYSKMHSHAKAQRLYTWEVLKLLRPILLRHLKLNTPEIYTTMIRHNLLVAFRSALRNRGTFLINLLGLSTGLACVLLIYLWVQDELKVDKFHHNDSSLYQLMEHVDQGGNKITRITTAGPTAEAMVAEYPEVEKAVTTSWIGLYTLSVDDKDIKADGVYASEDFFQLFSFDLLIGTPQEVLSDKMAIVISESLAKRLWDSPEQAIGKLVEWQHEKTFQVSGVFKDVPANSSLQFDFVLTFELFREEFDFVESWSNTAPRTYLLLAEDTDVAAFNKQIADFIKVKTNGEAAHRQPFVKLFSDRYLYGQYKDGILTGGRIEYVRLFSIVAVFILIIACINFMNLSTARASRRMKEVGIKKAVGAPRGALIVQYLSESTLTALLAFAIAVVMVILFLPEFNTITEKHLNLNVNTFNLWLLPAVVMATGLLAGSYPALYLSGFNPVAILKGKYVGTLQEVWARKGLVVFQFALSIILIVSVWIVFKQVQYTQEKNLGYDKANTVILSKEGLLWEEDRLATFLASLEDTPEIVGASTIGHTMTGHNGGTYGLRWPGKDPEDRTEFERVAVNYDVIEMLNFELAEGRNFSRTYGADSAKIIFNEAAIRYMGIEDPIGKTIELWGEDREIIGVVKDFHFESFHEEINPLFFYLNPDNARHILIKLQAGSEKKAIAEIEQVYKSLNPGFPFAYKFLDENYQRLYESEKRVSVLSRYFAGLAVLISCLGLLGLAAFTVETRQKEIGIRKVLGANVYQLVRLLSTEFTKMVGIAILIALPVSYILAQSWLSSFAYRITLEWWYFTGAGILALVIAWFTVGSQTLKAAYINPVECLKDE